MGNLFLGFPVARAKIADMISTSAPPALHKTQHQLGGTDELNITGLAGGGGGGIAIKDFYDLSSLLESLDGYLQNVAGTGSVTLDHPCVLLDTSTSSSSSARIYKDLNNYMTFPNFGKDAVFSIYAGFRAYTSKNGTYNLFAGDAIDYGQIGFQVVDGVLYGMCAKNAVHTTVALETISAGTFWVYRFLQAVFTAGSKVEFYVDGILKGTITTNLPTATETFTTYFSAEVWNLANAQRKILYVMPYNFLLKLT